MALRPVHRIKHVVDSQQATLAGVVTGVDLAVAVDAPVLANVTEVETGAKVNGIYLKVECYVNDSTPIALSNFYLIVWKDPGGNIGTAAIAPNNVGPNDNKRFVIHQEMVMVQQVNLGNPRTVFNGVIVIPKGYRRFAPNDVLRLAVLAPGNDFNFCVQCHYKEFR